MARFHDIPGKTGKIGVIKKLPVVYLQAVFKPTAIAEPDASGPQGIIAPVIGVAKGNAVKRVVHVGNGGCHPGIAAHAQVRGWSVRGRPAADGEPDRQPADVVPVDKGPVNTQCIIRRRSGGIAIKLWPGDHIAVKGAFHAPCLVHGKSTLEFYILGRLDPHVQPETVGKDGVVIIIMAIRLAVGKVEHISTTAGKGIHPGPEIAIKFEPGRQVPGLGFFIQHIAHVIDRVAVFGDGLVLLGKLRFQGVKLTGQLVDPCRQILRGFAGAGRSHGRQSNEPGQGQHGKFLNHSSSSLFLLLLGKSHIFSELKNLQMDKSFQSRETEQASIIVIECIKNLYRIYDRLSTGSL